LDSNLWAQAREEARDLIRPALPERLLGYDIAEEPLSLARYHAEQAGVTADIHLQQRAFTDLRAKAEYGCIITNPPYGERMGSDEQIEELYRSFPIVLRGLPTWSFYILSARLDLEKLVGQNANRRRKLYNGPIECIYYQFHGPRPPRTNSELEIESESELRLDSDADQIRSDLPEPAGFPLTDTVQPTIGPAFGGLLPDSKRQAEEFANRLRNRARHLRRWPTRRESLATAYTSATLPTCLSLSIVTKMRCISPNSPGRTIARPLSMPIGSTSWSARPAKSSTYHASASSSNIAIASGAATNTNASQPSKPVLSSAKAASSLSLIYPTTSTRAFSSTID
jgi:hypothetical protein